MAQAVSAFIRPDVAVGSSTDLRAPKFDFRSYLESGLKSDIDQCAVRADTVAKVENQTSPKISRKSIFRGLSRCNALWRRYEGPWSILGETMWFPHVAACETHPQP